MHDSLVLQVVIFREGSLVGTEVFLPGAYALGSDDECELLLADPAVSPCHAVLTFKEGKVRLEDLSGRGAVVINGAPALSAEVGARDDIAIGPFLVKVRVVGQKRGTPKAAPATPRAVTGATPTQAKAPFPGGPSKPQPASSPPLASHRNSSAPLAGPRALSRGVAPGPVAGRQEASRTLEPFEHVRSAKPRAASAEQQTEVLTLPPVAAAPAVTPPWDSSPRIRLPAPSPTPAPAATLEEVPAAAVSADLTDPALVVPAPVAGIKTVEELPVVDDVDVLEEVEKAAVALELATPPGLGAPAERAGDVAAGGDRSRNASSTPSGSAHPERSSRRASGGSGVEGPLDAGLAGSAYARASRLRSREPEGAGRAQGDSPTPTEDTGTKRPASGPFLRVRVLWGDYVIGLHGFRFGTSLRSGPSEDCDVPLYDLAFPNSFELAKVDKGLWTVQIPRGARARLFGGSGGWQPVASGKVALVGGQALHLEGSRCAVELRPDPVPPAAPMRFSDVVDSRVGVPFALAASLVLAAILLMPEPPKETSDFEPKKLAPIRALLKPPPKKEQQKIKEKIARLTKREVVAQDPDVVAPKTRAQGSARKAIKAVEKLTSAGPAVESLLKATSKMAGGPKGYGDKGMGFKLSPLNGKPPIAMAGMEVGQGMGGFGAKTKGLGGVRGMGGGPGGGIGVFASGGVGKKQVAGTVVSAPARRAKVSGGSLPREAVAKVINEHLSEVRGCYERALLKSPGLAGKLQLEWTIDSRGKVSEIKVKTSTLRGAEVPNCIVSSLKAWTFPPPKGGRVIVSYPFLFNSVGF